MNKFLVSGVLGAVLLLSLFSFVAALDSDGTQVPVDSDPVPVTPQSTPVEGSGNTETGNAADPVDAETTNIETTTESQSSSGSGSQCKSPWVCSSWSACDNSLQTRSCIKENSACQGIGIKPVESQTCTVSPEVLSAQTSESNTQEIGGESSLGQAPITGAVTGTGRARNFWIAGVFILAVAVAGMLVWRRNKMRVAK